MPVVNRNPRISPPDEGGADICHVPELGTDCF